MVYATLHLMLALPRARYGEGPTPVPMDLVDDAKADLLKVQSPACGGFVSPMDARMHAGTARSAAAAQSSGHAY